MLVLLTLLWCIYVSECLVRQRPGEWLFRARAFGPRRASADPDAQLLGGRIGLSWTGLAPSAPAFLVKGDQLDLAQARARYEEVRAASRWLRVATSALFVWIMGGLTVLILTGRLLQALIPYAIAGAVLWLAAFSAFVVAFRRLHGRGPALEAWLTVALSPVSLMRAHHTVCVSTLDTLHPLAAAALLLDDPEFVAVARLWHFDHGDLRRQIESIARTRKLEEQLSAPPTMWEAGVARYCPRCHETYTAAAECCADCVEVRLQLLPNAR